MTGASRSGRMGEGIREASMGREGYARASSRSPSCCAHWEGESPLKTSAGTPSRGGSATMRPAAYRSARWWERRALSSLARPSTSRSNASAGSACPATYWARASSRTRSSRRASSPARPGPPLPGIHTAMRVSSMPSGTSSVHSSRKTARK